MFLQRDPNVLAAQSNEILTAVVQGARKEETKWASSSGHAPHYIVNTEILSSPAPMCRTQRYKPYSTRSSSSAQISHKRCVYIHTRSLSVIIMFAEILFAGVCLQGERNYIMQVVCEATQSSNPTVQVKGYECLVKIMSLYYDQMRFYMERALFGVRTPTIHHHNRMIKHDSLILYLRS